MRKGEITAFLSLIFVLLLSFITAMLESTVIQTSKSLKRLDADRAVFSVFGEYEKQLLEDYEILAVDGSYQTGDFREENLTDRMRYYGAGDMQHEIQGIQYLTDNGGSAFREQVLSYMEHTYGISLVRELAGMTGTWEEQEIQGEETNKAEEEINSELDGLLEENENTLPEENNPLPHVTNLKKSGILELVLPEGFQLSEKQVSFVGQPSGRTLRAGRGSFFIRQGLDGIEERLLFHEFLLKKFNSAVDVKEDQRNLSYELEYMLGQKESDVENLSYTIKKLLVIRFGLNYLYLQTDAAKQAEAEALALTLSTVIALPIITEAVKQALIAAWAFGESIVDLRALMSGKRAALMKDSTNWQLSLSSLLTLGTNEDVQDGMDAEGGLDYTDYLRVLLFLQDEEVLTAKALDRVEQNIRLENETFRVDNCVVKLNVSSEAEIREGLTYRFPVSFGYNWESGDRK